jgi:hypothetical protein
MIHFSSLTAVLRCKLRGSKFLDLLARKRASGNPEILSEGHALLFSKETGSYDDLKRSLHEV